MPGLLPDVDPDGLLEYSVVYTDRALNHMSSRFQTVMTDISATMRSVYNAHSMAIVPGSGTFGMEAVARQFANDQHCLVIRNGWFSFRWTQILDTGHIATSCTVLKARKTGDGPQDPFEPAPIQEVVETIERERPAVVFAPHVETSAGLMLPDDYLRRIADAVHSCGGLFVLDCIASGTVWVDMRETGVDVLVSAPQKGWSGSPCCALVMLSETAQARLEETASSSFACNLKEWRNIMKAYEAGGHAYYATMPTDALTSFRDVMKEAEAYGFGSLREQQLALGDRVRELLADEGFASVAAPGFGAPGVVVCYTDDPDIKSAGKFAAHGMQIAAGVPLRCDEPDDFQTFRVGLFGLDKLQNVDRTVSNLADVLNKVA